MVQRYLCTDRPRSAALSLLSSGIVILAQFISILFICFFFSSRRRHTRCGRDWSSDVCSSDLRVQNRAESSEDMTQVSLQFLYGVLRSILLVYITLVALHFMLEVLFAHRAYRRSEERRVGKECRSRWSTYD